MFRLLAEAEQAWVCLAMARDLLYLQREKKSRLWTLYLASCKTLASQSARFSAGFVENRNAKNCKALARELPSTAALIER